MPELPAEAVQAAARANSEHYEVCGERDCGRCTMIYNAARRGLDAALRVMAGVGLPTSCPQAAPESTQSPETPPVAPVYPPAPTDPAGTLSAPHGEDANPHTSSHASEHADLRRRYADAINRVLEQPNGWAYRGTLSAAVLAVRDDELTRLRREVAYVAHTGEMWRRLWERVDGERSRECIRADQAADILARLFPSIECVLIDHADELDDAQGRVDANLSELAHVCRELTGFDARTVTTEETSS